MVYRGWPKTLYTHQ